MKEETFKKAFYLVLGILILVFFTKDCDLSPTKFYKNIKEVKNVDDYLVLVNKNNRLNASYIPSDLESIQLSYANENKQVRRIVKTAFESLSQDAKLLGYSIVAVSAYRDYDYQAKLYQGYVEEKGIEYADQCSARPGHSEHQTGLSLDVMGSNQDYDEFEKSDEFEWMRDNAHLYGFIMRYPKGKEHITGFKYEPWHYRYVGVEVATYIHANNITLEEYLKKA